MRSKIRLRLLCVLWVGVSVFAGVLVWHASPETVLAETQENSRVSRAYNAARRDYLSLSKRDSRVSDLVAWEKAASKLLVFVRTNDHPDFTPRAVYLLGRLYERMYRERRFRIGLTKAIYFYEQLAKDYRGHSLADNALLYLGDLRRDGLKDKVAARAAYYEIVDVYPKSDVYETARARLGIASSKGKGGGNEKATKEEVARSLALAEKEKSKKRKKNDGLFSLFDGGEVKEGGKEVYSVDTGTRRPIVVIDPGHGGEEEGAHGVDGVLEKEVTLNISLMLDELLRERLRAKTVLTRVRDLDIPLPDRAKLANEHKADLFISIHTNASVYKNAKGIETYYLDNTNDKSSLKLAKRENAPMFRETGSDLGFMLMDLIQTGKQPDSIALAHNIQDALHSTLSRYYKGVRDLGVKKAPFYVLVGAHMPCVLVEVSFIDHPVEGRRLISRRYQKLVAMAIYEGIRAYFESRGNSKS